MKKLITSSMERATEELIVRSCGFMEGVNQALPYHNVLHTRDVVRAAQGIGSLALARGKINLKELLLLKVAAAGHDLFQGFGHGLDEPASANKLAEWMCQYSVFKNADIKRVKSAINSTDRDRSQPGYKQKAGDDYIEQGLCDADLAQVGMRPDRSKIRSERYYYELLGDKPDTVSERLVFLNHQLEFYESHEFYTEEAKILFPYSTDNIERTKNEILELRAV